MALAMFDDDLSPPWDDGRQTGFRNCSWPKVKSSRMYFNAVIKQAVK